MVEYTPRKPPGNYNDNDNDNDNNNSNNELNSNYLWCFSKTAATWWENWKSFPMPFPFPILSIWFNFIFAIAIAIASYTAPTRAFVFLLYFRQLFSTMCQYC